MTGYTEQGLSTATRISMLSRFLRRADITTLNPDEPLAIIGDVHGRADLLTEALGSVASRRCICVGDYVDRGPDSAAVLTLLMNLPDVICLKGNHEHMLLRFVDDPSGDGMRWLRFGGDDTLVSFGIDVPAEGANPNDLRSMLVSRMGAEMIAWLRALPSYYISGNVAVVHAGADPSLPVQTQPETNLIWGHDRSDRKRSDGSWIVHGHTIVPRPEIGKSSICIDTGAYLTGRLTTAFVDVGKLSFHPVGGL